MISQDLIFVPYDKEHTIIYNGFWNKATVVVTEIADLLRDGVETASEILEVEVELTKTGILYKDQKEYETHTYYPVFEKKARNISLKQAYLHLTYGCNLSCVYCYNKKVINNEEEELGTDDWIKIINKMELIGVESVILTGGEVFLREDLYEICQYIKNKGIKVTILTNGTLLHEGLKILEIIDSAIVSLDSIDEKENAFYRKNSEIYKVLSNLTALPEEIKKKITVREVVVRGHEENIRRIKKYFADISINTTFSLCLPNNYSMLEMMPNYDTYELVNEDRPGLCGMGRGIMAIGSLGEIYPCQTFNDKEHSFGNILDEDWMDNIKKLQKENSDIRIFEVKECQQCLYKYLCRGGCKNIPYRVYNNENTVVQEMCRFYKKCAESYLKAKARKKGEGNGKKQ